MLIPVVFKNAEPGDFIEVFRGYKLCNRLCVPHGNLQPAFMAEAYTKYIVKLITNTEVCTYRVGMGRVPVVLVYYGLLKTRLSGYGVTDLIMVEYRVKRLADEWVEATI